MNHDPPLLSPRHPEFRPGLIFERLLDASQAAHVNHYALKHITGKAASRGEKRMYTPAEVRLIRQRIGPPDQGSPRVLALRSLRRRCGRTMLVANLGAALAFMGYRVLCLDADPQGDLGACCGVIVPDRVPPCDVGAVLVDFLQYKTRAVLESALVPVFTDGMLDLLPGGYMLATLDAMLGTHTNAMGLLQRLMLARADFFARYDVVIIDCAPGSGRLQALFTSVAQLVVMPARPDAASLAAGAQLVGALARVERMPPAGARMVALANGVPPAEAAVLRYATALAAHVSPWPVEQLAVPRVPELDWSAAIARGRVPRMAVEAEPFGATAGLCYALARALLAHTVPV